MTPIDLACPSCHAAAGEPCRNDQRAVNYFHHLRKEVIAAEAARRKEVARMNAALDTLPTPENANEGERGFMTGHRIGERRATRRGIASIDRLADALRRISYNVIDESISREGLRNVAENALLDAGITGAARADDEAPREVTTVNDLLHLGAAITTRGDELKVYTGDAEGGTSKDYLDAAACERLAGAFADIADRLRLSAAAGFTKKEG